MGTGSCCEGSSTMEGAIAKAAQVCKRLGGVLDRIDVTQTGHHCFEAVFDCAYLPTPPIIETAPPVEW